MSSAKKGLDLVMQPEFTSATSLLGSESQNGHYCSDVLDELKENISPLRSQPSVTVQPQNLVVMDVGDHEVASSHLIMVEDMCTPIRRTTFVGDNDHCSPKYVTRTPERRIINVHGFQSTSSPQSVPDCYGTPLRRTTFVKHSPKLESSGHVDSSSLLEKLKLNRGKNVIRSEKESVGSEPGDRRETNIEAVSMQLSKLDDTLRDVSRSPLILEDRLLHLQDTNQSSDTVHHDRPISTASSGRGSPTESEYYTAVTTPFNESQGEGADVFLDSNICSETITGDTSLCQQQLALKAAGHDVTNNYMLMENAVMEPVNNSCVDFWQTNVVTSRVVEYEVRTEIVSEVVESEFHVKEATSSLRTELVKPDFTCALADIDRVVCEREVEGFECAAVGDGHFLATRQSTPLLSNKLSGIGAANNANVPNVDSEPSQADANGFEVAVHSLTSDQVDGLFCIPVDGEASCIPRSHTFTKICTTPSSTADVSQDAGTGSYNRTYTKSANRKAAGSSSGSQAASRPLFADNTMGSNSIEDAFTDIVPLDMAQSDLDGAAESIPPETCEPHPLTKPEVDDWNKSIQLSGIWFDGQTSVMNAGVFSEVGGQTRHMLSPGQKRQSLIARLHGAEKHSLIHSDAAVTSVEHGRQEWLEGQGSPVKKRPLIAASKPCEYCFLMSQQ